MEKRVVKRREFLKVSAAAVLGTVATACAAKEKIVTQIVEVEKEVEKIVTQEVEVEKVVTQVVEKEVQKEVEKEVQVTVEVPKGVAEPPLLQAKVAAGELPPLAERIPQNPVVVGGRDAIGQYGGEIRMITFDPLWFTSCYDLNSERFLHYSDVDTRTIVPNVLESWESSADGKEWTFKMRAGMKWSDGVPITTEDVRFWWEDFCLGLDYPEGDTWGWGVPWQMRFGGENAKVDFLDDFTFKITHAAPFGNFGAHMTRWGQNINGLFPSHHFKKYLPKYNKDQASIDALVEAEGQENWKTAAGVWGNWQTGSWYGPPGVVNYPVYCAWRIVDNPQSGLYLWERNPYYWKVDLAGNQLPYVDNLRFDYVQTTDATKLKLVQGEIDILGQHDVTMNSYPYYKQNAEAGKYVVGDYISCMIDRYVLFPQHYLVLEDGTPDEVMNAIVNHPNWVRALSVAIDRDEVNETLFFGLARVGGMAPMPSSSYYKPNYGTAWSQYDPDLANQLLDEMGLDQRDSEGFRLRPDGKRLTYMIEHAGIRVGESTAKYTEMVVTYWREIGIEATTKEILESLYGERMNAFKVHCGIWHADRCTDMLLHIQPQWYIPTADSAQVTACAAWVSWFNAADRTDPTLIQPPDEIKALYGYFDKMTEVVSEDERVMWGQKIFDYLAENPLEIGLVLECPTPLIFNKNLRNLPRPKSVIGWDTYGLSTYFPEAFFYEGGQHA
jgi:peptide/nickel transport system substrate-binding protein